MKSMRSLAFQYDKLVGLFLFISCARLFAGGPEIQAVKNNWSGFYVGSTSGYVRGNANESATLHDDWLTDGTQDDVFLGLNS